MGTNTLLQTKVARETNVIAIYAGKIALATAITSRNASTNYRNQLAQPNGQNRSSQPFLYDLENSICNRFVTIHRSTDNLYQQYNATKALPTRR